MPPLPGIVSCLLVSRRSGTIFSVHSVQGCLEAFLVIPSVPSRAAPPLPLITDMLLCERAPGHN